MHFPPPPPPPACAAHPAIALARQLDCVVLTLVYRIAQVAALLGGFLHPVLARLHRANRRVAAILARVDAGTWRDPIHRQRPSRGGPPAPYLPRRPGWLGHVAGFQARAVASQLQTLLHSPETTATLAAAPATARLAIARALKTPCRLLNVPLPPPLQQAGPPPPPPPPRPRAPRTPRPAPEPIFPPIQPYVLAAVRALKKYRS
jgi:hypothetical protein